MRLFSYHKDNIKDNIRTVKVIGKDGKILTVECRCGFCGSRAGKVIFGSIHVYFYCFACERYTDLGFRIDEIGAK